MFSSYCFISWFESQIYQAIAAQQHTGLVDASVQNSQHRFSRCTDCVLKGCFSCFFAPDPVWAHCTKIMDFTFHVMEISLIKHKYGLSQKVAIMASSPLRGDGTKPLNIYGDTEIQIAVCDFLSSSRAIISCFQSRSSEVLSFIHRYSSSVTFHCNPECRG